MAIPRDQDAEPCSKSVMPGLVPGIHVLQLGEEKTWMAGYKPGR